MPQLAQQTRSLRPVRSVLNAIDVLEALGAGDAEFGVSELSRATGLSKTAAYYIVNTLEQRHWVMRNPSTSRYRLGWRVYELGADLVRERTLQPVARPFLEALAAETGETVLLSIRDSDTVLYIDQCESSQSVRMVIGPGRRAPLHATATGKVLLAFGGDDGLAAVLGSDLVRRTEATITEPAALAAVIDGVRGAGFATCWMENEPQLCSVAVPVRGRDGPLAAALGVAGPAFRVNEARQGELLDPLRRAAAAIERQIGTLDTHAEAVG